MNLFRKLSINLILGISFVLSTGTADAIVHGASTETSEERLGAQDSVDNALANVLNAPYASVAYHYKTLAGQNDKGIRTLNQIRSRSQFQNPTFGDILKDYKQSGQAVADVNLIIMCIVETKTFLIGASHILYYVVKGVSDDSDDTSDSSCSNNTLSFIDNQLQKDNTHRSASIGLDTKTVN